MSDSIAVARNGAFPAIASYAPGLIWLSLLAIGVIVQVSGHRVLMISMLVGLTLTTITQVGASLAFFSFLRERRGKRIAAMIVAASVILVAPFLIPPDARTLRFVTSCASVVLVMKLGDLHVHASDGLPIEWSRFAPFVFNAFSIVLRTQGPNLRSPLRKVLIDPARGIVGSILGLVAVFTLHLVPLREYPLLLEHTVKAVVVFVAILSWFGVAVAAVRLSGGVIRDFSDAPLLARTPADLWRLSTCSALPSDGCRASRPRSSCCRGSRSLRHCA